MKINNFKELYVNELRDLYSAETQLVAVLPRVAEAAHSTRLSEAVHGHLGQTMEHAKRLEAVFAGLEEKPGGVKCRAMEGLVREVEEAIHDIEKGPVRDAAIIGAVRRIEHYEIAGYSVAITLAKLVGHEDNATKLGMTVGEEVAADKAMSEIITGLMATAGLVGAR